MFARKAGPNRTYDNALNESRVSMARFNQNADEQIKQTRKTDHPHGRLQFTSRLNSARQTLNITSGLLFPNTA